MNFSTRANLSEWMDEPCSYEEFRDCLRDLEQVNRVTLAYRPTLQWLRSVLPADRLEAVHIVDVGCGGGDMLRQIARWAVREGVAVRLTGLDLNQYAARAAQASTAPALPVAWVTADAFSYQPPVPIDLVISSLFTHHLTDEVIVRFLQWMERSARIGWFINDLHRERFPYLGFKALAALMRWHPFVRHDGPISIRRSFRHADWHRFLAKAEIPLANVQISTFRPARLCVARTKP